MRLKNGEMNVSNFLMVNFLLLFLIQKKKLIIVRDRLGISPLYFQDQHSFIFASDVNSIVSCLDKKLRLNKKRLFSQIALPYKLHQLKNETLFKDIKQLEPSRVLYLDILTGFL